MLDKSEFEKLPNEFEMVFHNGVIDKGDKEEMKSELESELEEKKQVDKTVYNVNKEKASKAKEFKKIGNNDIINVEQQLDEPELQIKLELIMLEQSNALRAWRE